MSATPASGANSSNGSSDNNVPSHYKVISISFNQDCTALAMGTGKAYSLFTINQKNKIGQNNDCGVELYSTAKYLPFEEVRIIERLFSSSLIALVSDQAPRKLNMFHFKKGTEVFAPSFVTSILAVKLNRLVLAVCLEESISLFDLKSTLKHLHTINEIPSNPTGLCALSPSSDNPYLAYPGSPINGEVLIFDTVKLKDGVMIHAHDGPLVAMSFDMSGSRIATASVRGTVIRIHSAIDGACLFEFRRGVQRVATIYSLAFSPDSMFLAASSNTGTIHIFRMSPPTPSATPESDTWMGVFGRLAKDATYFLPKQTKEMLTQDRSFATVHLVPAGLKTAIAMNVLNGKLVLFVAGFDGIISGYEVNTTEGGECKRISHDLLFNLSISSGHETTGASNLWQNRTDEPAGNYPPNVFQNDNNSLPKSSD